MGEENRNLNDSNQYLSFKLSDEIFAFDISRVREVLEFNKVTRVPRTPAFMKGVINLRGRVVPVIDMKQKFGMGITEKTIDTCIIIVEIMIDDEITVLGTMADAVQEVMELEPHHIEPAPRIGTRLNTAFIKGMGKKDDEFIIILDIDRVFSLAELAAVKEIREPGNPAEGLKGGFFNESDEVPGLLEKDQ